jgi:YD repeat-containing protein
MIDPLANGTGATVLARALAAYNAVRDAARPPAPASSPVGCLASPGYVNPANGNLMVRLAPPRPSTTDFLPTFTYNSLSRNASEVGTQWNASYDRFVEPNSPTTVSLFTGFEWFMYTDPDPVTKIYTTPPGATTKLQGDATTGWTETQADGSALFYDATGTLGYLRSKAGTRWTLTYNLTSMSLDNAVTEITGPFSRVTSFSYDTSGNLLRVQDPGGRITSFSHDENGNLTRVTSPELCVTSLVYGVLSGTTMTYLLESVTNPMGGRTTFIHQADGRIGAVQQPLGQRTTYTYLESGPNRVLGGGVPGWLDVRLQARVPTLENGPEIVVQDLSADLQQQVRSPRSPTHLLLLDHPLADHLVDRRFRERRRDPLAVAIPVPVVRDRRSVDFDVMAELLHRLEQLLRPL